MTGFFERKGIIGRLKIPLSSLPLVFLQCRYGLVLELLTGKTIFRVKR
jgi:hypothetical protein